MGVPTKVVFYLIPILLLVAVTMVFWAQGGAWEDMKDVVTGLKDNVYSSVGFGTEIVTADVSISSEHTQEIEALVSTIQEMQGKEECFAKWDGFSDLGEEETSITFEQLGEDTRMMVRGGDGGENIITELITDFENMKPCVIAGINNHQGLAFLEYYLEGGDSLYPGHYNPVNSIQFYFEGGILTNDGNKIVVTELGITQNDNFKSDGWLYTPDGENICFFPTTGSGNDFIHGLPDRWFDPGVESSIPDLYYQLENNVVACS